MKRILTPFTLAAVGLFFLPTIGHAQATGGAFINGNVGSASLDRAGIDDDDSSYGVNAGYRWVASPRTLIGFEVGYADLGTFSESTLFSTSPDGTPPGEREWSFGTNTVRASKAVTIGANGRFDLSPSWYIGGRAGLLRTNLNYDFQVLGTDYSIGSHSYNVKANGVYAGAGVGYDFSKKISLGLNYDYYGAKKKEDKFDPQVLSVSGEYRF